MTETATRYRGVVVGSSLGGIEALQVMLGALRTELAVPIVVAHHVAPAASMLEKILSRTARLPVRWAVDGAPVEPGVVHLCPARAAVRWEPDGTFTVHPHERPSSLGVVDDLFASAADALGPHALAIVLSGAGSDGTAGARAVHDAGGTVVVQDEETALAAGMPGSVAAAGLADLVLSLAEIPELLDRVIGRGGTLPLPEVLAAEAMFAAGGEMGALMAATDWSRSALGPVERWSPVLRATLAMVLGNEMTMGIMWGPNSIFLYNDRCRDVIGGKHPDALGQPLDTAFPETAPLVGPLVRQVRDTGRGILQHDLPMPYVLHGSVEERFFTLSYSPLRDGATIVGLLSTTVDTTRQVQGSRRLRALHRLASVADDELVSRAGGAAEARVCERAAEVLANDPEDVPFALLYLADLTGTTLHLAAATGLPPGTVGAPHQLSVSHPDVWPTSAAVRRGEPTVVDDLAARFRGVVCGPYPEQPTRALVLPAGRRADGVAGAVVVLGASARITLDATYRSFLDLVADQIGASVTAARRRREARERIDALTGLDRDKNAFFANVSHEFRTPLTLTLGPLEQLLDTATADLHPDDVHAAVRLAHRNALRLLKLVNTLLEFAQLEQGRTVPRIEDVDLAALTVDLASVFRSAVEKAGLQLVVDCPPLPQTVPVDPELWERIVLNLVSNALKHTFDGSITVTLRQRQSHVELDVADTGIGIAEEELPRLFTRFHRVRGVRARSHEGSGLGLALVQQLARLHRGSVRVRSTVGEGTRFTVWLPLTQRRRAGHGGDDGTGRQTTDRRAFVEEARLWLDGRDVVPGDVQDTAPATPASPGRPAVLLVEDNPDLRDYVSRLLADRYAVTTVADGARALDVLAERSFDLVLADVLMPELDGLQLLAKIRADPLHRATPVILLTALADPGSTVAGLAAGAHDYVVKPFTARELVARVEAQLALARLRAEPGRAPGSTT